LVVVVALATVACGTGAVATVLVWLSRTIRVHQLACAPWRPEATSGSGGDGALRRWFDRGVAVGSCCCVAAAALIVFGSDRGLAPAAVGLAVVGMAAVVGKVTLATTDIRSRVGQLAGEEARFRSLVTESHDVVMVLGQDLVVRWQSPAAARQFGLAANDVLGQPFPALVHPLDSHRVSTRLADLVSGPARNPAPDIALPLTTRLRDGTGQWRDTETAISDQRAVPAVGALVLHIRDLTARSEPPEPHRRAWTDELTGLGNRRKLLHAVAELRAGRGRHGALLLIELTAAPPQGASDGRGGDEIWQAVLVEASHRLRATTGENDVVARVDGERFCVLVDSPTIAAYAMATRLATVLGDAYRVREPEVFQIRELGASKHREVTVRPQVSVGVAALQGASEDEDVLRRADLARRRALQVGRSRVESFDECIETALVRRLAIEQALPGAADRGELDLVYQVVLNLDRQRPVGVEALLRWRHPVLGSVPPDELLSAAEQVGAMEEIGQWVLDTACHQIAQWRKGGWNLWLSINISPHQLRWDGLAAALDHALRSHRIPPDQLVVELSEEGVCAFGPALAAQINALRSTGIRIAIDNFGICQGALANLRRLPIDVIKPNRALFEQSDRGERPEIPILEAVVEVAKLLSLEVIATGLETTSQVTAVLAAGCRLGQGRHLAAPEHAERVEAFLESHRAPLF
jgi:diguanylate cyclase (GGDEF)-like protein/PAS domain S-box-containing protein